jgi:hypothetical protein
MWICMCTIQIILESAHRDKVCTGILIRSNVNKYQHLHCVFFKKKPCTWERVDRESIKRIEPDPPGFNPQLGWVLVFFYIYFKN